MIKNQKGQILIEVLLAVVILGTALVALLYGLSNAVWAVNTVANDRTAMNLARSQMEYVQAQSFDGDFYIHYLKLPRTSLPADISPNDIRIEAFQKSDYLQLITVTVKYVGRDAVLEDYKPNHQDLNAELGGKPTYTAIFANDTAGDDETVNIKGSNWRIQGRVISKSGITLEPDKDNKVNGDVIYWDEDENGNDKYDFIGDEAEEDGWGNVNGLSLSEADLNDGYPPPISYTSYLDLGIPTFILDDADDGSSDDVVDLNLIDEVWVDPAQKTQLKPGIYYYEAQSGLDIGVIKLSGSADTGNVISGRVTFIAEGIDISGYNLILSPYTKGVLAFTYVIKEGVGGKVPFIKVTANNSILSGALYAPGGKITIGTDIDNPVNDDIFAGMLVAEEVEVYGEDSSIGF